MEFYTFSRSTLSNKRLPDPHICHFIHIPGFLSIQITLPKFPSTKHFIAPIQTSVGPEPSRGADIENATMRSLILIYIVAVVRCEYDFKSDFVRHVRHTGRTLIRHGRSRVHLTRYHRTRELIAQNIEAEKSIELGKLFDIYLDKCFRFNFL